MRKRNTRYKVVALLLAALLLAGCGSAAVQQGDPTAAATAAPVESTAPELETAPEDTIDQYAGTLTDREGRAIDLSLYPELKGAQTAFAEYLAAGDTVSLTVDLSLQDKAAEILSENLRGASGSAVVVRTDTGEPLAIVSAGGADALEDEYQPSELFFPCTAIAALSEGVFTTDGTIKCNGVFDRYKDEGYAPVCWIWPMGYTHPEENVTTALRDGCNYYFYHMGNDLGIDQLAEYVSAFGLGQPTGIELPESAGRADNRLAADAQGRKWSIRDTIETADGRGENAFTPLQYAEYCVALANRGARYSASILHSVTSADGAAVYERRAQELTDSLLAESAGENWDAVQQGMYEKLNSPINETLSRIHSQNQWKTAGMCGYGDDYKLFMGYAPYDAPQIAATVAVDRADGDGMVDMNDPAADALGATQIIAHEIIKAYLGE